MAKYKTTHKLEKEMRIRVKPNAMSTNIVGQKFRREFDEAVSSAEMNFDQFKKVLLDLGFLKNENDQLHLTHEIWDLISSQKSNTTKASSLFNFLCYLLQIDAIINENKSDLKKKLKNNADIQRNAYGYVIDEVFYM